MDVQIKFLEDCDPEDGHKVYLAGSVHKLNPASARHWTRRGKAIEITTKEAKAITATHAKADAKADADAKPKAKADAKAKK